MHFATPSAYWLILYFLNGRDLLMRDAFLEGKLTFHDPTGSYFSRQIDEILAGWLTFAGGEWDGEDNTLWRYFETSSGFVPPCWFLREEVFHIRTGTGPLHVEFTNWKIAGCTPSEFLKAAQESWGHRDPFWHKVLLVDEHYVKSLPQVTPSDIHKMEYLGPVEVEGADLHRRIVLGPLFSGVWQGLDALEPWIPPDVPTASVIKD